MNFYKKIWQTMFVTFGLTHCFDTALAMTNVEKKILNNFAERCANSSINAAQFPDAFLDNTVQSSCEIAATFLGGDYAIRAAINTSANVAAGVGALSNEDLRSVQIRARHFNYGVDDEIAIRTFSVALDDPTYITHAQSGDPYSIWNAAFNEALSPIRGGKGLSQEQSNEVGKHIGQPLADFIFLNQENLRVKYPDYQSLVLASNKLISQSAKISRGYLQLATANLITASMLRNDHEKFWFIEAMLFPHRLRLNLLKLQTLTGMMGEGLINAIRIIEFGEEDKMGFFHLGTDQYFNEIENLNIQNQLLDCIISLNDALRGVPTVYEASFYAMCLQNIEASNPGTMADVSEIFDGIPLTIFSGFDYRQYKRWSVEQPDESQEQIFSKLFAADIRHAALNLELAPVKELERELTFLRNRPSDAISIATSDTSPVALLYLMQNSRFFRELSQSNVSSLIQTVADDANRGCELLSESQCAKVWRALRLEDYFSEKIEVTLASLDVYSNSCSASGRLVKKLLKK